MKFTIQTILTIIICFALQYFLPWWTMAIGAFGVGYFVNNKSYVSFFAGLVGAGLLWAGAAYYNDLTTHAILSNKIDHLLPLPSLLMTTLIGGIVGGFGGMTGALLRHRSL
jgi:hypothetical protein